mmetsp:Transcript_33976/g.66903  ORF Transcript_33976/g.66903 Transcript_33976/m.66903 type:complete len:358 (-) Transcript_33976:859-1932(-)
MQFFFAAIVLMIFETDYVKSHHGENSAGPVGNQLLLMSHGVFDGLFTGGGVTGMVQSAPGHLVSMGFGFLIVTCLAAYTANLASILTSQSIANQASDLSSYTANNSLCLTGPVATRLLKTRGDIFSTDSREFVKKAALADVMAGLSNGECKAAIISDTALAYNSDKYCSLARKVGDPVMQLNSGWLTNKADLAIAFNYYIEVQHESADLLLHRQTAFNTIKDTCKSNRDKTESIESSAMGAQHLLGSFIVFCSFTLAALLLFAVQKCVHRRKKRAVTEADDKDQDTSSGNFFIRHPEYRELIQHMRAAIMADLGDKLDLSGIAGASQKRHDKQLGSSNSSRADTTNLPLLGVVTAAQ